MASIWIITKQIITMFLYMGAGVVMYRRKLISREGSKSMAHLLLYCVLPCVIIRSFHIQRTPENTEGLIISMVAAAGILMLSMAVSMILLRKTPIDNFGAAFSNAGFMGFPLITSLLGESAVFYAAGFVALLNGLQWTYGQWLLTGDRRQISVSAVVKNPIILSLGAGLLLFLTGLPLPGIITDTVNALAALNAPVAMFVLGVYMAQADIRKMFTLPRLYLASAVRLIVIPLLSLVVLLPVIGWNPSLGMALLLAASAPVGSNVAVYAQKLDLDYTYAVEFVCVSTLLSVISMPLLAGLAQYFMGAV